MPTSVVIPCYNTGLFVAEAIRSAWDQSSPPLEVIVVDDGSTDSSASISEAAGARVVSQANGGLACARNTGLAEAKGDFILFLDADDRVLPGAIEAHLRCFAQWPDAAMVYGSNYVIDASGDRIGTNLEAPHTYTWRDILFGVTPTCSQAMFRRDALVSAGGFDSKVRYGEDLDLNLRLCASSLGVCHGELVADYRKHPGQMTKRPAAGLESTLLLIDNFCLRHDVDAKTHALARRHWRIYFGQWIPNEAIKSILRLDLTHAKDSSLTYFRHFPDTLIGTARRAARFGR